MWTQFIDKILYLSWFIGETATIFLLINWNECGWNGCGWKGDGAGSQMFGYFPAQGATMLATFAICGRFMRSSEPFYSRAGSPGLFLFLAVVSMIPAAGPLISFSTMMVLRFYPMVPIRSESFDLIPQEALIGLQKGFENRTIPIAEALLIRQLSKEDGLRMLAIIDEMEWTPAKSGILRFVIRQAKYQNIVLMAIDMMQKKIDSILNEIGELESERHPNREKLSRLANLYHEICYLNLCEPAMKPAYLNKACDYAGKAMRTGERNEDACLAAVRYLLEAGRIEDAYDIYSEILAGDGYFIPKWLPYEFELSVRRNDRESFILHCGTIEAASGAYFPVKLKKAVRAWKRILTSAWL
ncbi:MAG: hypothetical protein C4530_15375 [Desulfobacteraceae bacterium]|nr:MAG: hypothetical protein C4530_15375 [Desulfobacteraceae bacterium]